MTPLIQISPNAPHEKQSRIVIIDAIRAFALLAILLVHTNAYYGFDFGSYPKEGLPYYINLTAQILFYDKAYLLFSLLFGLSFFLQIDRNKQRGVNFLGKFIWRTLLLFIFGILDSILYTSDILIYLALFGLFLPLLYHVNSKILGFFALIFLLSPLHFFKIELNESYYSLSLHNSLWDTLSHYFSPYQFHKTLQVIFYRIALLPIDIRNSMIIGMSILGILVGRYHFFNKLETLRNKILIFSLISILLYAVIRLVLEQNHPKTLLFTYTYTAVSVIFTCTVPLLISALYSYTKKNKLTQFIVNTMGKIGKCTLTCYITQNVFFIFFYAPWGFNKAAETSICFNTIYSLIFFFLQLLACHLWLCYFKYGPFEYLWRCATMFKWQPLKKHPQQNLSLDIISLTTQK